MLKFVALVIASVCLYASSIAAVPSEFDASPEPREYKRRSHSGDVALLTRDYGVYEYLPRQELDFDELFARDDTYSFYPRDTELADELYVRDLEWEDDLVSREEDIQPVVRRKDDSEDGSGKGGKPMTGIGKQGAVMAANLLARYLEDLE